jgi:predicted nucleic-acid-binding protein
MERALETIVIDTNVLARIVVESDEDRRENEIARDLFKRADEIIIPTHVLCEFVWVLSSVYKSSKHDIHTALASILKIKKVIVAKDEANAGMYMLDNDGDFADGVNAYAGQKMARENSFPVFASFDKQAVCILKRKGIPAVVPEGN